MSLRLDFLLRHSEGDRWGRVDSRLEYYADNSLLTYNHARSNLSPGGPVEFFDGDLLEEEGNSYHSVRGREHLEYLHRLTGMRIIGKSKYLKKRLPIRIGKSLGHVL